MNVIQRRSSSTFSLSLPHSLSLFLASSFLSLPLTLARTLWFSLVLSLYLSRSRCLSPFHSLTVTLSRCLSLRLPARIRDTRLRVRATPADVRARMHAGARARTEHRIWMDDPSRVMFSTASSLKLDFFCFLSTFRLSSLLTHGSCLFIILADRLRSLTLYSITFF